MDSRNWSAAHTTIRSSCFCGTRFRRVGKGALAPCPPSSSVLVMVGTLRFAPYECLPVEICGATVGAHGNFASYVSATSMTLAALASDMERQGLGLTEVKTK